MKLLIFLFIALFFICIPPLRCLALHPFHTIYFACKDTYRYFRYCRWREYHGYGTLTMFNGLFGAGKTLSSVVYARKIYKRYNGRKVFDFRDNKWKTQYINIVTNVHIQDVPYIPLKTLSDIITITQHNDGVSIWLVAVDEMSTQINSREYKTNFSTDLLNILLTCRHYRIQIIGSSQRFSHVDALVRQVTQNAIECRKFWRCIQWSIYDAWKIENTSDVTKIKPNRVRTIFVTDKDFNSYDTTACVESFKANVLAGNHLTDQEILDFQSQAEENFVQVNMRRRFRKRL